jgi:predicted PurR-regulated permease PerM
MKEATQDLLSKHISKHLAVGATLLIVVAIFFFFYKIIAPFMSILFVAFVITVILSPLQHKFIEQFKLKKSFAAIAVLFIFLFVAIIPLSIAIILLFNEIKDLIIFLRANVRDITYWEGIINEFLEKNFKKYGLEYSNQIDIDLKEYILRLAQFVSQSLGIFISKTGALISNSIITLIAAYYMLVDKDRIISFLSSINPLKSKKFMEIQKKSVASINATIKGNLTIIILQGFIGFLGFIFFNVQSPFLLGFIYGIFAIIPNIGAALIWIPSTIYIYVVHGPLAAFGFIAWCYSTNFVVDQFITPKILGGSSNIHPLLILFGVLGGIQAFGLIGIILGPFIITLFFIAIDIYKDLIKHA